VQSYKRNIKPQSIYKPCNVKILVIVNYSHYLCTQIRNETSI